MGKVGDDEWGRIILDVFRQYDQSLVEGMIVRKGEHSSYSIVISPEDSDRFLCIIPVRTIRLMSMISK
ncbi:hypothetical protein ACI2OX_02925 [Bacillus sp. N9]